jgi:hypothetical protein
LIRQLYPQKADPAEAQAEGHVLATRKQMTEDAIEKALTAYLERFLLLAKPLMSAPDAPIEALKKIFSDAGRISIGIWTQLRRFELVDLKYLPQSFGEASQLMPELNVLEAHAMHRATLEENEKCLDDRPILFITSPGIVA